MALAYDPGSVGKYFVPRFALLYPLACLSALILILRSYPWRAGLSFDVLDLAAAAFAFWQAVAAVLSPAPVVAWLGYYNRGTGAVFWVALVVLFVVARRLLSRTRGVEVLAWVAAGTLAIAGIVAAAQAAGAESLWGGSEVLGRVDGTTGNPITLAGVSLLGLWLAAGLPQWRRSVTRFVVGAGAAGAAACLILSVSRAAYLGLAVGTLVLAIAWALERRRRALFVLGVVVVAAVAVTVAYGAVSGRDSDLLSRIAGDSTSGLTSSDSLRVALWHEASQAVAWRPLTGVGAGAFVVVDRRFRSPERKFSRPWELASDPHSLPLLVGATSGIPGLLLAGLVVVLLLRQMRIARRESGRAGAAARAPTSFRFSAGLAYLTAAVTFLLFSPLDPVLAVPMTLVAGATCGAPLASDRLSWQVAAQWSRRRIAVALTAALVTVGVALLVVTAGGVQWWRADRALARSARDRDTDSAVRAAQLWGLEPFYSLEAGAKTWRQGLSADDSTRVSLGRSLVQRGIARDRTGALGYADLARLDIAQARLREAVTTLREGLTSNPHQPVLQGLWGYAALVAETQVKDGGLAGELLGELRTLPADSPDAWFWISRVLAARGDTAGEAAARARARRLAPLLGSWRYRQRLLHAR